MFSCIEAGLTEWIEYAVWCLENVYTRCLSLNYICETGMHMGNNNVELQMEFIFNLKHIDNNMFVGLNMKVPVSLS